MSKYAVISDSASHGRHLLIYDKELDIFYTAPRISTVSSSAVTFLANWAVDTLYDNLG